MRIKNQYYVYEFTQGHYHVCSLENDSPVYDDEPNGNDKPTVWTDKDVAIEYKNKLNKETRLVK